MESQPQNPEFRNNPEMDHHDSSIFIRIYHDCEGDIGFFSIQPSHK